MFIGQAEAFGNSNRLATVYRIMKELPDGRKTINGPMREVNGKLLIQDDEQLNR